jgi:hypothetical protein
VSEAEAYKFRKRKTMRPEILLSLKLGKTIQEVFGHRLLPFKILVSPVIYLLI